MSLESVEDLLNLRHGYISAMLTRKRPLYARTSHVADLRSWKATPVSRMRSWLVPCVELKIVQRRIHHLISARFEPHPIAHGYVTGRGIVTNARMHVGKEWLFHVDLVDFFGSITEGRVFEALCEALPEISSEDIRLITSLCCYEGFLPQGSPCSPILSNLACFRLDQQLQELASELGVVVSRYSDDICFSSSNAAFPSRLATFEGHGPSQQITIGQPLSRLFEAAGFEVNWRKVRLQRRTARQQVTGVIVNNGLNLPKEFYREVRWGLKAWEKHGLHVAALNRRPPLSKDQFVNSLRGLIEHIGLVRGRENDCYRGLCAKQRDLRTRDLPKAQRKPSASAVDNVSKR